MFKHKITVFTPTYNRAHLLERLYRSIQQQTFRDFEWLIVDDGSKDNTAEVVAAFVSEQNDFPIRYYAKENGGKGRAINYALDLAEGELFFVMDSDDYLTEDALEKIVYWERTIQGDKRFCGVAGNRGDAPDSSPNVPLPGAYLDVSVLEKYRGNKALLGEHAEALYTDIFRKYKYPEFDGEKFVTPCIAFDRMAADGYIVRYFQDIVWICKYLEDGITMNARNNYVNNPRGYGLTIRERMEFCHTSVLEKFKAHYGFYCDMIEKYNYKEIASFLGVSKYYIGFIELIYRLKRRFGK